MRLHPDDFDGRELELIYIARAVDEAQKIEAILDERQVDYAIRVEQFRTGVIFASVRAGAFFYVLPELAPSCRAALTQLGYRVQEPVPPEPG